MAITSSPRSMTARDLSVRAPTRPCNAHHKSLCRRPSPHSGEGPTMLGMPTDPNAAGRRNAHATAPQLVALALGVNPASGLSEEDARTRLARDGPNVLPTTRGRSLGLMLREQVV